MAIEQAMKSTVANDPQINDLDGKRISASAALIEEKKKIDAKDKLINELMLAREKDKERYEMTKKEKERVDRLFQIGKKDLCLLTSPQQHRDVQVLPVIWMMSSAFLLYMYFSSPNPFLQMILYHNDITHHEL